jgi:hypothetical protein
MSFTPEQSRIRTDASIEEQIAAAPTAAEIQRILRDAAVNQGLVRPDIYDPNVLHEVPAGDVARAQGRLAKTVTINGKKYILEGASEQELVHAETNLYRSIFQPEVATEQTRDAAGRFVEVPVEPSPVDDAVAHALKAQGISIDDLRATVAEKQGGEYRERWAAAVEEFKNSPTGQDWVGGQDNLQTVARILQENPELMDAPSVETLAAVWDHMKQHNLVAENPEVTTFQKLSAARSPEEIREALGRSSTSLFGR